MIGPSVRELIKIQKTHSFAYLYSEGGVLDYERAFPLHRDEKFVWHSSHTFREHWAPDDSEKDADGLDSGSRSEGEDNMAESHASRVDDHLQPATGRHGEQAQCRRCHAF
jgi:hypothetical protein